MLVKHCDQGFQERLHGSTGGLVAGGEVGDGVEAGEAIGHSDEGAETDGVVYACRGQGVGWENKRGDRGQGGEGTEERTGVGDRQRVIRKA